MIEDKLRRIEGALRERDEVVFAYLFGSIARGRYSGMSDVDIGVYLRPDLPQEEVFRIHVELASELSFRDLRVDLVILNEASLKLAFEVIKGKLLLSRDECLRKEFVYRTIREYLDRRATRLSILRREVG